MGQTQTILGTDELIIGEAVALELPAAGIGVRLLSGAIDYTIALIALGVTLSLGLAATSYTDEALTAAATLVGMILAVVGIPVTLETLLRGRTVGKLALGLRTVRDDAGPISFRHALVRALVGYVELWFFFGVPAVTSALLSSRTKRLGDFAAGTYVVRERVRVRLAPPPQMPPFLQGWARRADIAALPDALAMGVRQFLGRANTLSPAARATLGRQLYADTMRFVAPAPPAGVHAEDVLAAVLAERRHRDTERLIRHDQLRARLLSPDPMAGPR